MSAADAVISAGEPYHTGYVVKDLHAAIKQWVELAGVGPFVAFDNFEFVDPTYRGAPGGPKVSLAFGYSGAGCIELIQPLDSSRSIYTEAIGAIHHIGLGVRTLDEEIEKYRRANVDCAFKAAFAFGSGCAYLDTRDSLGMFTELVELCPIIDGMHAQMQRAHETWNRRDYTFTFA